MTSSCSMTKDVGGAQSSPPRPTHVLLAVLLFGLGARAWVISLTASPDFAVDHLFDTLGWNIAARGQFTLDGITPAAHVGPLYPSLLGLFYAGLGHQPDLVPYLHVFLDTITAFFVFGIGRHLFSPWVGTLAASAFFLYPAYWMYDIRIRAEPILTLLMVVWTWAMVKCITTDRPWPPAGMGLVAGLTILCKPVVMPLAIIISLWLAWSSTCLRSGLLRGGLYMLCCLLTVLPWTMRNNHAFGQLLPVSTGLGVGLWMGSDPVSLGSWPMPNPVEAQIWETAGITPLSHPYVMYEVSNDNLLRKKGWSRIKADPATYVWLTVTRVVHFWIGNKFYLLNSDQGFATAFRNDVRERGATIAVYSLMKRLVLVPALLILALCSLWVFRIHWRDLFPLYAFPIGLTLGYVPFTVESGRYALPVLPCLFLLAAALAVRLCQYANYRSATRMREEYAA